MIIGNGQLAKAFTPYDKKDFIIFASGVSNSSCLQKNEFEREETLLIKTLSENKEKKFVYFSSCALSANDYKKNAYYIHKKNMEEIITNHSGNYYIFRLPQLFGKLKHHETLINYIYEAVLKEKKLTIYNEAYRYVIEIEDVRKFVISFIKNHESNCILDIANPYRYQVIEIVKAFELLLGKQASYDIESKHDGYFLELSELELYIRKYNIDINFDENYLFRKLSEKINLNIT